MAKPVKSKQSSKPAPPSASTAALIKTLCRHAEELPGVQQTVACKGTVIEAARYVVGGKAFFFVAPKNVMLKLDKSAAEARDCAAKDASNMKVGAGGWVTVLLAGLEVVPAGVLKRWIGESHALMASAVPAKKR
jgi:hypothetical protein